MKSFYCWKVLAVVISYLYLPKLKKNIQIFPSFKLLLTMCPNNSIVAKILDIPCIVCVNMLYR